MPVNFCELSPCLNICAVLYSVKIIAVLFYFLYHISCVPLALVVQKCSVICAI